MSWFSRLWAWLRAWADDQLVAGPLPILGIGLGAGLNASLLLIGTSWFLRLPTVLLLAFLGRFSPVFGKKMEGWHLETVGGALLAEWLSWILFCHGPCAGG